MLRFLPRGSYYNCDSDQYDIEMFSSEQGKWTKLVVTSPGIVVNSFNLKTSLIACDRMLFTLNYKDNLAVNCILGFDPFNDPAQFLRVIDLPLEAVRDNNNNRDIFNLGVCRCRLRFSEIVLLPGREPCSNYKHPCVSIWEFDDYSIGR